MSKETGQTALKPVRKVVAYVTRRHGLGHELLVFRHAHFPQAGVQVPGGGAYPQETMLGALMRELAEESGLDQSDVLCNREIADYTFYKQDKQRWQRRHVFWLESCRDLPDRWEHVVSGDGKDSGLVFQFEWIPVAAARTRLSAQLGDKIQALELALRGQHTY